MKFGLGLPHYDFSSPDGGPVTAKALAESAGRAEALGFDSVWISDHYFLSLARYGGRDQPFGSSEALAGLAALSTVTERVRLGTLVLCAGFRHPALLAKAATTIDLLSSGRLDLGVGAGWYEDEYRAFGHPFGTVGERFEILEETVEVLARLWGPEEPVTWRGRRFRLHEAYCHPRPAQDPRPPLWVGGKGGPRLLRLAARRADGWNTVWAWTPEAYAERARALDAACADAGRDPTSVRRSVGLLAIVGEDERDAADRYRAARAWVPGPASGDPAPIESWADDHLAGGPERVTERIGAFARLGVEELIVSMATVPFAVHDWSTVEVFARDVIPGARSV